MMKKRILAMVMAMVMCLSLLPVSALATDSDPVVPDESSPTPVAQITTGDGESVTPTQYETLDSAITAAEDGATIELLADCTTEGMNLEKNLTIQAKKDLDKTPTITFTKYGIALWGKSLTFKNCNVVMNGIGSTPYTSEWGWMTICASKDASLSLDNVNMTMNGDPENTGTNLNKHAIYFCSNNKLNLTDSNLTIKNYQQDALEWDGGDGGYNVNITNSTFLSDHNRSGFTGIFCATIENSKVDVVNSIGNGSNGSHFIIKDSSIVNFNDNTDHGLSAGKLSIDNSTVKALRNGGNGIHTNSTLTITNKSAVDVKNNECKISSLWTIPGAIHIGNGDSSIDGTSTVVVQNNNGSGILLKAGTFTVSDGASLIITNNTAQKLGFGGGINNRGTISLPANVILYNNHAGQAGDDIYNSTDKASILFGPVGSDWALDGDNDKLDCNGVSHAIDGWYDDAEDSRWEAHAKPVHVEEFTDFDEGTGIAVAEGSLALKAAHALTPLDPDDPETENWKISKSKTATNLDKNFESKVTLSLPSAQEELVTDVVFVLDKSTSADLEKQALTMLQNLKNQIDETNAKVKVGVVIFNKEANVANDGNFFDLSKEYDKIKAAIEEDIKTGTNTHAGLLAGKAMLDNDTSVDANRKYLIFVSDGISYMYNAEPTVTSWSFFADGWESWAGPDNWNSKYGNNNPPADWADWLTNIGTNVSSQGTTYEYLYGGTATVSTPQDNNWKTYANSIDKALYLTNQVYREAQKTGYHCYAVTATQNIGQQYSWGPSFMAHLANGETVTFSKIQNDIYYLLSAGSKVEDYIGYVENDYNFDFVNDASKLTIQVGDTIYKAEKINENQYGFHQRVAPISESSNEAVANTDYDYVLTYVPGNKQDTEHFVWDINVPITNFERVSLTYTVKLTNPKTASGTYGEYDKDGSAEKAALYTNNIATLYPVDSDGDKGLPENFRKPTVSYTVSGGGGGGSTKPPVLNTKDHYGYIIGYPEDYETGEKTSDQTRMPVKPMGNITRAEVATIFFRMLTDESRAEFWSQTSSYSDVEIDDWFNNAICTLSNANIISGYPDGTFKPNGKITRAEFATIASRFFEYADENIDNPFSDVPEDSWYYRFVLAASEMGLINGYPDGTFKPNDPIIRCEACAIMNRTLDRHPDQKHFLKDMLVWVDNMDTGKWYYDDMQEATNSHEYKMNGSGDSKYETWTKMLPIRDWAAFEREWSDANSASGGEVVN